jgi:WD40 repeat protein
MTFSPDGKLFATGGADGLVILWDPATGKELARLNVAGE